MWEFIIFEPVRSAMQLCGIEQTSSSSSVSVDTIQRQVIGHIAHVIDVNGMFKILCFTDV